MTIEEFIDFTKGRYTDDVIEYKGETGVLYWGDNDICWEHDDGDDGKTYRFHSDKEFLESRACFWGKRLEEIVSDLTIQGYEYWQKYHME